MLKTQKGRHTMRGTRFKQEQIVTVLKEAQARAMLPELSRKYEGGSGGCTSSKGFEIKVL